MCTSVFYAKVRVLRRDWLICEITRAAHGYNKRVQRGERKRKRKLVIWNLKTKKISRTHFSSIYEQLQNLINLPDLQIAIHRQKRQHNQEHLEWTYAWYSAVVKLLTPVYQHNWSQGTVQKQIPKAWTLTFSVGNNPAKQQTSQQA